LNNREFFNSVASKWDSMVKHDEGKIRNILDMLHIKEGQKVLDVGTGTGVMVPFLHSLVGNAGKIVAVDISEKMIEIARGKFEFDNVDFIVGDVLEIKLPENEYDLIMCYSMFPHFDNQKNAVNKLSRHLKKGGKLAICHSQSRNAINSLHAASSDAVKNDRLPPADCISDYYKSAGLETVITVDNEEMFVVVGQKA